MKTWANKVKILNENVDKQSQNTHVEVNNLCQAKVKGSKYGLDCSE